MTFAFCLFALHTTRIARLTFDLLFATVPGQTLINVYLVVANLQLLTDKPERAAFELCPPW